MRKLLNKILKRFGLIKISRAEQITIALLSFYEKNVLEWVKKDFDRDPKPNHDKDLRQWAKNSFLACIENDIDDFS
jgi:hypothetical protein